MEYNFSEIESKWQQYWKDKNIYEVKLDPAKPKYYVLDMFPYPSGAGLHVGHPLGYIASDIYARYKRLKGFNVLHPMGFDSFGLPAEQYALETGQHPAVTTEKNIATFKNQLDKIGFCYDWSREVRTSNPDYYRWTQWIFLQLFESWFHPENNRAEPIETLVKIFETSGSSIVNEELETPFFAAEWKAFSEKEQQDILMHFRLAFSSYGEVNWCEALGTVLANDEVVNGVSERGGHPVEKRKMRQWYLRITKYANRLLEGLNTVNFSESMKEMQRNWIGKSEGAEIQFSIANHDEKITVYTTRPDTICGVDFIVLAPEHELVKSITSAAQQSRIDEYLTYVKSRSDRERQAEVKQITGCDTGAFAINPFDGRKIPIYIAEYVLSGYGTGAIMAVPCGDQRDFLFAQHFEISITNIIGHHFLGIEANPTKEAILENSAFLTGMKMKDAIQVAINKVEEMGIGKRKVNYRMRDAGFSRQRYWGEPFPIIWSDGVAIPLDEKELPLQLPFVEKYGPGKNGEGPLSNLTDWVNVSNGKGETSTMPGYAGSSWYFLRFMDPHNATTFADKKATDYWNQVDVYIGGTEHAVGHLLYSRMWTKFLYDRGLISFDEPFKKLVNQGMIGGISYKIIRHGNNQIEEENSMSLNTSSSIVIPWKLENGLPKILHPNDENEFDTYTFNFSSDIPKINFDEVSLLRVFKDCTDDSYLQIENYIDKKRSNYEYYSEKNYEIFLCKDGYFDSKKMKWFDYDKNSIEPLAFLTLPVHEKMSKRFGNVVNPDDIVREYGADTFRMYEMFLGPIEQSKPWDTKGIEGVHRFLRKLWRLFFDETKGKIWIEENPTEKELKILHRTIKKITDDTERFSFNTAVSGFMVCLNELHEIKCHKRAILEPLLILLAPYAPHIAEELYHQLGNESTVVAASYPKLKEEFLIENEKEYPVSINGKLRTNMLVSLAATQQEVEDLVLKNEIVQKWMDGKPARKIIYVKNKMINVVV